MYEIEEFIFFAGEVTTMCKQKSEKILCISKKNSTFAPPIRDIG